MKAFWRDAANRLAKGCPQTWEWLEDTNEETYSFDFWCRLIDANPEVIRQALMKRGTPPTPEQLVEYRIECEMRSSL